MNKNPNEKYSTFFEAQTGLETLHAMAFKPWPFLELGQAIDTHHSALFNRFVNK